MKQNFTVRQGALDRVEAFLSVAKRRSFRRSAADLHLRLAGTAERLFLESHGALGVWFDCLPDAVSLPKAEVKGMISVLALPANLTPVMLLTVSWTGHHCWLRSILANLIEIQTAWRSGHGRVPQCRC
jgi:hypothetical protein